MADEHKEFTPEELEKNNGAEDAPVYICYQGRVIDVSQSKMWKKGKHMQRHSAGQDLSDAFKEAPHGTDVLDRYPQVGTMKTEEAEAEEPEGTLPWFVVRFPMLKRHPHPMTVHFPIVFAMAAPLFLLLGLITAYAPFERTSFHCLGAGILVTPVAILTGLYTWWMNYMSQLIRQVVRKLFLTPVLLVLFIILFCWRFFSPDLIQTGGGAMFLYVLLVLLLIPLVTLIGWYGATMTFPLDKD
ncbi:MAG: cytochrome b5 [Desulfohalobiaceae bacterium]|nr:cytochrome b5 [Desulfohalobiaceae bacterium]